MFKKNGSSLIESGMSLFKKAADEVQKGIDKNQQLIYTKDEEIEKLRRESEDLLSDNGRGQDFLNEISRFLV